MSNESNLQLETRVSCPMQTQERKDGEIYITLKSHGSSLEVTQNDIDRFDWIIRVDGVNYSDGRCGFAPFVLHRK